MSHVSMILLQGRQYSSFSQDVYLQANMLDDDEIENREAKARRH